MFVLCFAGIRTEQDLFVRLIDSMTKVVSILLTLQVILQPTTYFVHNVT